MDEDGRLIALGERIRKHRESKDLSQTELAYKIGKDQPSINRVEKGKINPSYIYLMELAEGLDISVAELVSE